MIEDVKKPMVMPTRSWLYHRAIELSHGIAKALEADTDRGMSSFPGVYDEARQWATELERVCCQLVALTRYEGDVGG